MLRRLSLVFWTHWILLCDSFIRTLATAWVDCALAMDPWFLWNVSGETAVASIARLVLPVSSGCGCRVSDSATPCEKRTVEKEAILTRIGGPDADGGFIRRDESWSGA